MHKIIFPLLTLALAFGCNKPSFKTIGSVQQLDPSLEKIIDTAAPVEIIAEGFNWTEGPLWVESEKMLLFSDIPPNKIYKWTETKGAELYLTPSGYTGTAPRTGEPGSNGLLLNKEGKLVLCQHGDRRMAMMDAPLNAPEAAFVSLADSYQGKRNSTVPMTRYSAAMAICFLPTRHTDWKKQWMTLQRKFRFRAFTK